jgi:hypothetical protein
MSTWTEAFYDTDYGKDQTRRMAIFDDVFGFLKSIGCQPKWTCRYDGSDYDYDYGIIISTVAYNGRTYNHNPCYKIDYELPAEVLEKLDTHFGTQTMVDPQTPKCASGCRRYLCTDLCTDDLAAGLCELCNYERGKAQCQ